MRIPLAGGIAVGLLLLTLPGCLGSASAPARAERVANKMLSFDRSLQEADTLLERALESMDAMANPRGDLVDEYERFAKSVDKLTRVAKEARKDAEDATKNREEYFEAWRETQGDIQNPELKAASEARLAELAPKFDDLRSSLAASGATFEPLLQSLTDLKLFLGPQLNAQGIAAASELMARCREQGARTRQEIARHSANVRSLAASIRPAG